jgi:hypothetical protein
VTITTANGVTARTTVTVQESEVTATDLTPSTIGATDNSTPWWSAFSDDVQVQPGQTRSFTFTNYSGGSNWNNYVVILRNAAKAEYAVVRSDNFGWGNGYAASIHDNNGSANWAAWLAAMNGAKVTVYVTNVNNGTADVQAVCQGVDGKTYTQYYLGINTVDPADFYMAFTVDGSHMVAASAAAKKHTVRRR